jgi:Flp pilus assembly pilin Flp
MLSKIALWPTLFIIWARQKHSIHDDRGASLVEYALLLALIAVVAVGALVFLGNSVANQIHTVGKVINAQTTTSVGP